METARLVSLPTPQPTGPSVRVDGDRVSIDRLELVDPDLAAFVGERPPEQRAALVTRAFRVGLVALQDAGVTVNVDAVRREFDTLLGRAQRLNDQAAERLEETLRKNFADADGRLPRTLERFLGDRGALRAFVSDLFDEGKRDSAIGRMRHLLSGYFDGDASRLAQLLDPTRMGAPLYQFRTEVTDGFTRLHERLAALEAANTARASERSRSAAKGADLESLAESMLADLARGANDLLERTADATGTGLRSKKGDFVLTVDQRVTRGADLRVVIECKDRAISPRALRDELRAARENRSAAVALAIVTPQAAPPGTEPFCVLGDDVYCVVDPAAPDAAYLEAAFRLARLLALATLRDATVEVDAAAVATALTAIREQLDAIRGMKATLTSISTNTQGVSVALDKLRECVLARVADAELQLRVAAAETTGRSLT